MKYLTQNFEDAISGKNYTIYTYLFRPKLNTIFEEFKKIDLYVSEKVLFEKFFDFIKKDFVVLFVSNDEKFLHSYYSQKFSPDQILIKVIDVNSLFEEWKNIVYRYQQNGIIGNDLIKLIQIFSYLDKIQDFSPNKNKYFAFNDYEKGEAQMRIYTNNSILIKDNATNYYIINELISIFNQEKKGKTNKKRSILTKSIKNEVFKKNNYKCVFCGATKEDSVLEIDHIIPVSRGGKDTLDNLQVLCKSCNISKSDRLT